MRRYHLLPLLVWTALWALFFAPLLAGTARLPNSDLSGQFHAFGLFQAREMAAGRLPTWSPGSYGGIPFAGDTQAAVFYPPRWLTVFLSSPWGFPFYALQVEGLFHIWLAGLFTYLLAFSITRERSAGLIGAVAFGLGGYLTSYPLLQLAILETIAWLPLVLLLLRQGVNSGRPLPWLLGAGAAMGVSALAGHPQTFLHLSYLSAAYYLFLAWRARWRWPWVLGLGLGIAAVALGTAAVAWLPALHYLARSTRSDVSYQFVSTGLPLLRYVQLLVPGTLSFWVPEYVGLPAAFLVLLAWSGRRLLGREEASEIAFWAGAAAIAAWLSLGDKGILFELVHRVMPGFSLFRNQERLAGLVALSLALLAAQGLALWLRNSPESRRKLVERAAFALGGGLLLAGVVLAMAHPLASDDWPLTWARQWLLAAAVIALLWRSSRGHRRVAVLAVLLGLDLYASVSDRMNLQPESPSVFWPEPAWLDSITLDNPGRIDSGNLFHANVGEVYGLEDIRGLSPLKPRASDAFERLPKRLRWQLLGVTHVLTKTPVEEGVTLLAPIDSSLLPGEEQAGYVYRFESALPRAWMSYQAVLAPDAGAALEAMRDPGFDPAAQVILHGTVVDLATVTPPSSPPRVRIGRPVPGSLSVEVTTETPGILVISEWAYPGWRVALDGEPVPILAADYALQGILVPAGTHTVEARFSPLDVALGCGITIATLVLVGAVAWRWRPVISYRGQRQLPQPAVPGQPVVEAQPAESDERAGEGRALRWRTLLLPVVLLGFGLRMFNLGSQELRGDEAFSYLFSRVPAAEVVPGLIETGDPHPPLHYLILHGWMQLAGSTEFAMRFASVAPGVLALPLVAQLGRQVGGRRSGLLAALLAAISQSLVWVGQDVRSQYTLAIVFSTLATLLLVRAVRPSNRASNGALAKVGWWLCYAMACTLTVYSYYYGVIALLAHGLYLLVQPNMRRWLWAWLGSGVLAALMFAPWAVAVWPRLVAAGQLSDPSQPELAHYLVVVGTELAAGPAYSGPLERWLFLGAAALCVVGARVLFRRRPGWAALLVGWLIGAALFIYLLRFTRSTFNAFYITVATPAWWALLSVGVMALWAERRRWRRAAAVIAVVALVGAAGISLAGYYSDPDYQRSSGYRGVADHIAAANQPGDLFVAHFPDPALDYYLDNVPVPRIMLPASRDVTDQETEQALARLAADYDRLWFQPRHGSVWDPEDVVFRWLDYHMLHEQEARYQNLELVAYRPLHSVDRVLSPVGVSMADLLHLEGVYVTVDGVPADLNETLQLAPGSALDVTLVWEARRSISENYTVLVHVIAEDGTLIAQHDGVPLFGTRPTSTWEVGERLLDLHRVVIPEGSHAATGSIWVAMYLTDTLERQQFADGGDAVPISQVRVEPRPG